MNESFFTNVVTGEEGANPEFTDFPQSDLSSLSKEYDAALARRANGDISGAVAALQSLAEQNYAPAQTYLGWHASTGEGVPRDTTIARALYKKAADQGYPPANLYWGLLEMSEGRPTEGIALIRMAAEQRYPSALFYLGLVYEHGRGVSINQQEAIRHYELGADLGSVDAIKRLVTLQLKGHCGIKGFLRALLYFASIPIFAVRIARRYGDIPEYVSPDVTRSLHWWRRPRRTG